MHTKQAGCFYLFVCLFVCLFTLGFHLKWKRFSQNSPRETLVSRHNPVRSLKVHLGRTLAAGAVSPSPSRFQLCAHFCSPQSLWVNKRKPGFPPQSFTSHTKKRLQMRKRKVRSMVRSEGATGLCRSPRKVAKQKPGFWMETRERHAKVLKGNKKEVEIKRQREAVSHRASLTSGQLLDTNLKVESMWLLKSSSLIQPPSSL